MATLEWIDFYKETGVHAQCVCAAEGKDYCDHCYEGYAILKYGNLTDDAFVNMRS